MRINVLDNNTNCGRKKFTCLDLCLQFFWTCFCHPCCAIFTSTHETNYRHYNFCPEHLAPTLKSGILPTFAIWEMSETFRSLNFTFHHHILKYCIFQMKLSKPPWCLYKDGKPCLGGRVNDVASQKQYIKGILLLIESFQMIFSEFYKRCSSKTQK